MLDTLIQGLLLGGLYCLFALGQSLMFGVMRLTNIAHGDLIVLAAFGIIAATKLMPVNPMIVGALMLPVAFALGFVLQRFVLNRTLSKDSLPSVVVTFGLSIVIQNGLLQIFSGDPRSIEAGDLAAQSIDLPGLGTVGTLPLCILTTAVICTFSLQWVFGRTSLGRAFRAVSDDPETAELMGLDNRLVFAISTGIAFIVIALAGLFQGLRTTVSPFDGPLFLLIAFEAVIIGGMGSFWGTFVGSMLLGLSQQIGFRIDTGWGVCIGHLVFLLVLILRPQGLFPKTRT